MRETDSRLLRQKLSGVSFSLNSRKQEPGTYNCLRAQDDNICAECSKQIVGRSVLSLFAESKLGTKNVHN